MSSYFIMTLAQRFLLILGKKIVKHPSTRFMPLKTSLHLNLIFKKIRKRALHDYILHKGAAQYKYLAIYIRNYEKNSDHEMLNRRAVAD